MFVLAWSLWPARARAADEGLDAALVPAPVAAPVQAVDGDTLPAGVVELPLAPRVGAADGAQFRRLPAEESGVDFRHQWRPEARYLHVLGNAMAGGGVALGDVDADGWPELFLTRPAGGSRLYRNRGGLRFADMSAEAGLLPERWGGGASFGDLDGDGDLDLYVCGYDNPDRLYWNEGEGRLREGAAAAGLDFNGAAVMFALSDYDLDGDLDGYLLTNRFASQQSPDREVPYVDGRIVVPDELVEQFDVLTRPDGQTVLVSAGQFDHLYRNDGDGMFRDVSESAGIEGNHYGLSATWWDPDDDGWPDLYVANDFFGPDKLYRNQRDGRFVDMAQEQLPHTPWFSMGSDAGDVDGDGLQDYFASDMSGTSHLRRQVTMTDLSEGRWFLEAAEPRQYMRNALYLNTGAGRFLEAAMTAGLARSDWSWSTLFGDLDADGRLDLFVSNGMSRDYFNYDLRAQAARHDAIMSDFWVGQDPLHEANLVFRNEGDLEFASVGPQWGLDELGAGFGAILGDLDRDGDLDVVVNNFEAPVSLFENRGTDGHVLAFELRGRQANTSGLGARVTVTSRGPDGALRRQVRHLTLAHGYMAGAEPRLHFGLGDHAQLEQVEVRWPGGTTQTLRGLSVDRAYRVTEPDAGEAVDADGASVDQAGGTHDPAEPTDTPPAPLYTQVLGPVAYEQPYDDYERQPLLPARLSQLGPGLACGDIDGDGDDDLVLGGPAGQAAQVMVLGGGMITPGTPPALQFDDYYEDQGVLLFDADRDGDLDLYVASGGVEGRPGSGAFRDRLYLNDGAGTLSKAPKDALPGHKDSSSAVAAADLDGDGDLELFVGARSVPGSWPEGGTSRLLRNDDGRFVDAVDELAPGLSEHGRVTAALFSDADGDGDPDLLVAHEWGPVRLWRHDGARLVDDTAAAGLAGLTGWWSGLAAGDPDHDGDLDYLASNLGLGSRTRPSVEQPDVLLFGDLDGSGTEVIVETTWVDGVLHPVRTRNDMLSALPFLAEFFPTFDSWGRASIDDVFGPQSVAAAGRLEATTAESGWLVNDGAGHFTFEPLPRRAQISAGFGVAVTEIDGDGHPDVYLVQNSFAPQAEHGRLDGGVSQALLGDGAGGFTPLRADHSGLLVPGDGKSLALLDLDDDHWPDFAVGVNDGPLTLFLRRGPKTGRCLAVRLAGAPGNPTGIGARISYERAGLPMQTVELAAGSGYLAQSAAVAWFGLGAEPYDEPAGLLRVRWPDGAVREQAVAPGTTSVRVTKE